MYIYIYMCVHIHIYTCMNACIQVGICMHIYTYKKITSVYICLHTHT